MEWWQEFGVGLQFMSDTPALAFDMTATGPQYEPFRYSLMYNMQNTSAVIPTYPSEGMTFPEGE